MSSLNDNRMVRGESFVWLTGLGLAIAITMAVVLLGVILWQGATAFWPKAVVEMTITKDGVSESVIGEVVQVRERLVKTGNQVEKHEEFQLFTGNKDSLGAAFRWIDSDQVTATTYPADIMEVERLEYGKAMGRALRIKTADYFKSYQ